MKASLPKRFLEPHIRAGNNERNKQTNIVTPAKTRLSENFPSTVIPLIINRDMTGFSERMMLRN